MDDYSSAGQRAPNWLFGASVWPRADQGSRRYSPKAMNWFRRRPREYEANRWSVTVRGGPARVKGHNAVGFETIRIVIADDMDDALEKAYRVVQEEFATTGVQTDWELVSAIHARPMPTTERPPKETTVSFWENFESQVRFFDDLEQTLDRLDIKAIREGDRIVVPALHHDRFEVSISWDGTEFTVEADPWHAHYVKADQAAACFKWLLSPIYRIAWELKDGEMIATWLERFHQGRWQPMDTLYFERVRAALDEGGPYELHFQQQHIYFPSNARKIVGDQYLDPRGHPPESFIGHFKTIRDHSRIVEVGLRPPSL